MNNSNTRHRTAHDPTPSAADWRNCPNCGEQAFYARAADRYVHADGSSNRECWLALSRGTHQQQ